MYICGYLEKSKKVYCVYVKGQYQFEQAEKTLLTIGVSKDSLFLFAPFPTFNNEHFREKFPDGKTIEIIT